MFDIKNFKSEILTTGVLPSNRYIVTFPAPLGLRKNPFATELDNTGEETNVPGLDRISLRCESVQFPGMSFAALDGIIRYGYGPTESIPYVPTFDDLSLTFLVDRESDVHRFFYSWMNIIVNYHAEGQTLGLKKGPNNKMYAYEVGYKDEYVTRMDVAVYGSDNRKVMTGRVYNAYPKALPPIDLNWGAEELVKITIPFAYTDFDVLYENNLPQDAPTETQLPTR